MGDVNRLCPGCMRFGLDDAGVCTLCGVDSKAPPAMPHHLPQRSVVGGKYLVARVLGEGGFGITYLGWDINLEVKVAIKEYYPLGAVSRNTTVSDTVTALTGNAEEFFLQGRERFVDEARRLARFHYLPGIVSVRDFFQENGTAYIVMEFIEGETLKDHLEKTGGRMAEQQTLALFQPLLQSLAEVHRDGIIHRDISPDNLMLTPSGRLCLLDFGAARDYRDENKSLSVLLKPGYAPEEQYRSKGQQGPWTDVYALSATIYRTLEGEKPPEAMERVMEDTLAGFTVPVSGTTAAALMKGLRVRQADRWQSLDELYAALYPQAAPPASAEIKHGAYAAGPAGQAAPPPPGKARAAAGKGAGIGVAAVAILAVLAFIIVMAVLNKEPADTGKAQSGSSAATVPAAQSTETGLFLDGEWNQDPGPAMTIGGQKVDFELYRFYYLWYKDYYEALNGADIWENDPENAHALLLKEQVMDALESLYAWLAIAGERGLEVTPEMRDEAAGNMEGWLAHRTGAGDALYTSEAQYMRIYEVMLLEQAAQQAVEEELRAEMADEATALAAEEAGEYIAAKHILVTFGENGDKTAALAKIQEMLDTIRQLEGVAAATAFEELMQDKSEDTGLETNPNGYFFKEGDMVSEFYEAARALDIGEISEPVETQYGYHLILRLPISDDNIKDIREAVLERLVKERAEKLVDAKKAAAPVECAVYYDAIWPERIA